MDLPGKHPHRGRIIRTRHQHKLGAGIVTRKLGQNVGQMAKRRNGLIRVAVHLLDAKKGTAQDELERKK